MRKKVILGIVIILSGLVIWQFELIKYGIEQGRGRLRVIWNSVEVEDYLSNPNIPDSIRHKLLLVEAAKRFAIDSLGINESDNYSTFYDQKGKAILWVVTASEEFQFVAKTWTFPILGSVSYKGYFDLSKARTLQKQLVEEGWDTSLREVGGWSTLGWFKDPILSKMLERSDGDLAEVIIHELTHGTLFVKDSVEFNENLATFIGQRGAERFLAEHYGRNSEELASYMAGRKDRGEFCKPHAKRSG